MKVRKSHGAGLRIRRFVAFEEDDNDQDGSRTLEDFIAKRSVFQQR